MQPRRYVILALGLAMGLATAVIAANARLDPYGLAGARTDTQPAAAEGRAGAFWRKAASVRYARPRAVILGTSRAHAIDPRHPAFAPYAPALSLSLGAVSIEQMRLLLVHAHTNSPLRLAVIGLDLEAFQREGRADFDAAGLDGNPESEPGVLVRLRINLSRAALSTSLGRASLTAEAGPAADREDPFAPGKTDVVMDRLAGQRGLVWITEFNNFYSHLPYLLPHWSPDTVWHSDARRAAAMASFRALLDYARREGIELRFFISPLHARYLEWYRRVGWWPMFEAWKHALVTTIDEESRAAPGLSPFPLWDFSGYHSLALEPVPAGGDMATRMRWHLETGHYSRELGNLILDRVLGHPGSDVSLLPDGRIDRPAIDQHLQAIRLGADRYRLEQPREVADVGDSYMRLRRVVRK